MWEIMFQPNREDIKIKGRLIGIYIQDEKKWLEGRTQKDIDKMTKIRSDGLAVRPDPKRFNFVCYVEYDSEFDETYIHIVVKED